MNVKDDMHEIISYCLGELSSKFDIEPFDFHKKLNFIQLAQENITSQDLYLWSAPIDLIEHYQHYLNQLSTENNSLLANKIFYNCTWPKFGPKCQYELYTHRSDHSSTYDIIYDFYNTFEYNPIDLTCYEHLQCNHRLLPTCLDWTEICNGQIDCLDDGIDEENCWQLEINECKDDEYRCKNGQCIPQLFYRDDSRHPDCLDNSDEQIIPSSLRQAYCTSETSFRCEDMICTYTPLTSSCTIKRQDLLLEVIYSNRNNSTSEECWLASKCILKILDSEKTICENLCANDACINIILNDCPDILYIPNSPALFGHFYFAYKKTVEQYSTTGNIWLLYICYTISYYDMFFDLISNMTLNNRTCFFYKTISYSSIQSNFWSIHQDLQSLYTKLQKYHLMYNYNSTICNRLNMYQCMNSTKCISVYRLLDNTRLLGIDHDCPYMDDENITVINNNDAGKQLEKTHFKCQTSNKYIARSRVKNNLCECGNAGIDWCDDEGWNSFKNISFQTICDGFIELLPIMINGQNHTDETECQQCQCDDIYTHCNGVWNCLNGADEINCYLSRCPTNHNLCVSSDTNQLMCLPIEKFNDGKIDCLGATDEIILCRQKYS